MAKKNHRKGGKFRGSHTSIIPTAGIMADAAAKLEQVHGVSLGYIQVKQRSSGSRRTVKFIQEKGSLLLSVRHNSSSQEVRIYCSDCQRVQEKLSGAASLADIVILKNRGGTENE